MQGPLQTLDALVVLGCRPAPSDGGALGRRARAAAAAFERGAAPRIVTSGGRRWSGLAESEHLATLLTEHGVPRAAIECEHWSMSTAENAHFVAEALLSRGERRVGVVTCSWHLQRALACFTRVGFSVQGIPALGPERGPLCRLGERLSLPLDCWLTWGRWR
ncbi:MAG TPA: YdcF family protein [Polyangiaceae bacterium]